MNDNLSPGEQVVIETRPHILTILSSIGGYLVSMFIFLVILVFGSHVFVQPGQPNNIVFYLGLGVVLVCLGGCAAAWVQWKATLVTLTNHRIIFSRGVLSRSSTSIALNRIQDVSIHQNVGQRIVKCGNIEIESAGKVEGAEMLHMIPNAKGFANTLNDLAARASGAAL